jgi:hypothetical protein
MKRRGERQKGFAMLLVFVMAASIAILLYRELPRVAFEAQRNKEALLIERGEQYSRAIQLYVRKWKKYPATMEDLESTNQVRFLRKRYIDPMTGKSEWRIVHVGPGGVFLDSLVNKPPKLEKEEQKSVNTFTYEAPTTGAALQPAQGAPGFTPVRPSERGMRMPGQPGQPVDPSNPQAQQQPGYPNPNQPGVYNPNQPGVYNPNQPGAYNPNPTGAYNPQTGKYDLNLPQPAGTYPLPPGVPGVPSGVNPGQPVNPQTGAPSPYPYSTQPGAQGAPPPFGQPGTTITPGGQQNQALTLINQILTTPRAGGMAAGNQSMGGLQIAGGIAGVASTVERTGIKVYNEKEKYNEWEFLYDLTKDKTGAGAALGAAGIQQQQQQQGIQGLPGQQQQPTQSPFGQPGIGAQPGVNTPQFPGAGSIFGPQQPVRPR